MSANERWLHAITPLVARSSSSAPLRCPSGRCPTGTRSEPRTTASSPGGPGGTTRATSARRRIPSTATWSPPWTASARSAAAAVRRGSTSPSSTGSARRWHSCSCRTGPTGCIGSMEGLYFESSATTPYHFLSNSELSLRPPRPQRDLPYRDLDLNKGVQHLQLMGVRYYMTLSERPGSGPRAPGPHADRERGQWTATVTESGKPAESRHARGRCTRSRTPNGRGAAEVRAGGHDQGSEGRLGVAGRRRRVVQAPADRGGATLAASGPKEWARVSGPSAEAPRKAVKPATVSNIESSRTASVSMSTGRRAGTGEDVVLPELAGVGRQGTVAGHAQPDGRDPNVEAREHALRQHAGGPLRVGDDSSPPRVDRPCST